MRRTGLRFRELSRRASATIVAVLLVLLVATVWSNYEQRQRFVNQSYAANIAACQRGMADRQANMDSWYAAYMARVEQAKVTPPGPQRVAYLTAASVYLTTVKSLEGRVDRMHSLTYRGTYPLGYGTFSCAAHYHHAHVDLISATIGSAK